LPGRVPWIQQTIDHQTIGFLCTMIKVGKSDCEGTFAGTHGNDKDAP
jgi:hypothetical protein